MKSPVTTLSLGSRQKSSLTSSISAAKTLLESTNPTPNASRVIKESRKTMTIIDISARKKFISDATQLTPKSMFSTKSRTFCNPSVPIPTLQ